MEKSSYKIFQECTRLEDIKTIKSLEDIEPYIVGSLFLDNNNLKDLHLPRSLSKLVATYLDTYNYETSDF